jgi:transposase
MITPETRVQIRRYFYAEHWKIGTIAQALNVHPDTVRRAIEVERFQHAEPLRPSLVDPYLPFVRETLEPYPRLRATRLYQMIRDRGYSGSVEQLRRTVARLRPQPQEAFLRLQVFPAEQAQVDWAYFGSVMVGRAKRQLSCFVMTLSWSRALYLEFFFDQTTENFLRGHVRAFQDWSGTPRVILYDNLKSAVLERRGDQIHFNPRLLELAADYHSNARGPPDAGRSGKRRLAGAGLRPRRIGRPSNLSTAPFAGPARGGRPAPRRPGSAGTEHSARLLGRLPVAPGPSLDAPAGAGSQPPSGSASAGCPSSRSGELR